MLTKLFQSRNMFFINFYSAGRKHKSRFSKFLEFCCGESKKTLFQNKESEKNAKKLAPKTFTLRDIYATSSVMKEENTPVMCELNAKNGSGKCKCKICECEKCECKNNNKENGKELKKEDNNKDKKSINEDPCEGKENLVAVLSNENYLKLEERKKPTPCPGEVLIAMNCVGLCATDLNNFMKGKLPTPLALARDGTGIVTALGEGVQDLCEGDRVVILPFVPCGKCEFCKKCQHHLCSQMKSCGLVPYDGLLACYCTKPAKNCHKLPDSITMEEGVLLDMLANGIDIYSRCPMCIGAPILIIGAGPIGLVSLIAAKAMGATRTCVMCQFQDRLKVAKTYKTKTVSISIDASPEDMAQYVREELGCVPLITVDSVGSESSMKLAIAATESGGTIVLASVTDGEHKIPLHEVAHRDISIRSSLRHSNKFSAAIDLASSGSVNLKPLISHHFSFEEVSNAVNTLMENKETSNKVIIHMRPRDRFLNFK